MPRQTRRNFVRTATLAGLSAVAYARVARAAADLSVPRIGFIGCGGRSRGLHAGFREDSETVWVCDPDQNRAAELQKQSDSKHVTGDLRRVLDDKSVDAVVVATPDHWHAPASIMACDAGKHVYVEKPCSHNVREGQWLVDAARRNGVVVQHGTQSRSNPFILDAIQMLREGMIGDVLVASVVSHD